MKVLITSEWYPPVINGVVTSIMTLRKGLEARGHEVRLLCPATAAHSHFDPSGFRIASLDVGFVYPSLRLGTPASHTTLKAIEEWGPDVVHSQAEFVTYQWAKVVAKRLNIPLVHTYHTVYQDYTHYFSPSKRLGTWLVSLFSKERLKGADAVIVPTQKISDLLGEYRVAAPIHVIPTGIDLSSFAQAAEDNAGALQLRKELELPDKNTILVYLGRLAKEKNLDEIFTLLAGLKRPDVTLVVVGDGPYRETLEQHVRKLGLESQVLFTGAVTRQAVPQYYALADVFVSGSQSETQGLTYCEAMAAGLPLLCKKDAVLDEMIIDGVNGWQYTKPEEFGQYLEQITSSEEIIEGYRQESRRIALGNYSMEAFAEAVEEVYLKAGEGRA
ncbi:MAG: glycosyltransferase family 4 protein [Actinomycetaceae bacterium]|nr:glycosyltransferase family 4 protein [Actinomycetaceae bacterium]